MTLCFRANGNLNLEAIPEWLAVEYSFDAAELGFYSVWIVPWIAEPALAVGALELDDSVSGWVAYLKTLGFDNVVQVSCHQFFSPRADRDR
ncbi:MAG: hypothetical protein N4J56_004366 [Chroococcidiopsis sp. SAG 2025]|nr:hypothetical protein [Chroococcidiopsis sp. SAG 2025]